MSEEYEVGKRWIRSQFHEVAKELRVPLGGSEWKQIGQDGNQIMLSFVYEISGTRHVEKFSRSEIDDSAGDPTIQGELKNRIRRLLEPFSPRPRRIGF